MKEFIEVPASKRSLSLRRPLFGIGINDAEYNVGFYLNGSLESSCPYYIKWKHMITRCYSLSYQHDSPTYSGCSVCLEWHKFSCFKLWMKAQDWKGKQLDKDLLVYGNKIYSPEACIFVSSQINSILLDSESRRGKYPQGVTYNSRDNVFVAQCRVRGVFKWIGSYHNEIDAEVSYLKFKSSVIIEASQNQTAKIKNALVMASNKMISRADELLIKSTNQPRSTGRNNKEIRL
jgi:hypothetical protein